MKVIHVVKTLNEVYGGPARSVQGLVATLQSKNIETWLVALDETVSPWVDGVNHFVCFNGCGYGATKSKFRELLKQVQPDVVHTHDLWIPRLHACVAISREMGVPYVIAPRGALEPWCLNHKWWKKYPALFTYQGYDLIGAAAIHSTADSETFNIRRLLHRKFVIYSPNGVILPRTLPSRDKQCSTLKRALFISRIHPKKGLANLVEAWALIRPKGWIMEIAGTDVDGYQMEIERMVHKYGLDDSFVFVGPVRESDKWGVYRSADLFILPTYSENFGIVVAEALYAGLPVITTKGTPWQNLETERCGWHVDVGVQPLCEALRAATSIDDFTRIEMGQRGHELISTSYSWGAVVNSLIDGYDRISAHGG